MPHNRDLDEQLIKPLGRGDMKNVDISSALDAPNAHSKMHIYNNTSVDVNSTEKVQAINKDNDIVAMKSNKTSSGEISRPIETPEVNTITGG